MAFRQSPADSKAKQAALARDFDALCDDGRGIARQALRVPIRALAQRSLEIPLGTASRTASRRFLQDGFRRQHVENDLRPVKLANARLRHTDLQQLHLYIQGRLAPCHGRAITRLVVLHSTQSGRQLPTSVRGPDGLEGAPRTPRFRRRRFQFLLMDQRSKGRLQRQLAECRGVRHYLLSEGWREHAGRRGLPLLRRFLSRRSGHVALIGDLPQRHAVVGACRSHTRFPHRHRSGWNVPQRRAEGVSQDPQLQRADCHRAHVLRFAVRRVEQSYGRLAHSNRCPCFGSRSGAGSQYKDSRRQPC